MIKFDTFKPAATCSVHLLTGAVVWSLVGLLLALRGGWNMLALPDFAWWWLAVAVIVGLLKGQLVFVRSARRSVRRIIERGDGKCLGGFIAIKNWFLIIAMIVMGKLLRMSSLHGSIVWGVYIAAGSALALSSRIFWMAWCRQKGICQ
jgi:hypothetical protein